MLARSKFIRRCDFPRGHGNDEEGSIVEVAAIMNALYLRSSSGSATSSIRPFEMCRELQWRRGALTTFVAGSKD